MATNDRPLHPIVRQLRQRRKDLKLTQREVASRAGVTQPCVTDWECGRRNPNVYALQGWANALDMAVMIMPIEENDW